MSHLIRRCEFFMWYGPELACWLQYIRLVYPKMSSCGGQFKISRALMGCCGGRFENQVSLIEPCTEKSAKNEICHLQGMCTHQANQPKSNCGLSVPIVVHEKDHQSERPISPSMLQPSLPEDVTWRYGMSMDSLSCVCTVQSLKCNTDRGI